MKCYMTGQEKGDF